MNLNSTGIIDLESGWHGPMCPNSMPPVHPSHQLAVTFADAAYEATPKDADGEITSRELEVVSSAVAYGPTTENRMRLYRQAVAARSGSRSVSIEALFFRCQICGLILPASRTPS